MKTLHTATAVIEFGAGLALVCDPSALVALLVGAPLETPAALTVARIGGAAVLSLGVACWIARNDTHSRAASGLVAAMTLYNIATVATLIFAAFGLGLRGVALWPAVALHTLMAVWCVACVRWNPLTAAVNGSLQHRSNPETGSHESGRAISS